MEMNTLNGKVGWVIAGVVVVLAILAYAVYDSSKPVAPNADTATTTATTTASTTPVVTHSYAPKPVTPAPVPVPTPAPEPTVTANGTIVFTAPVSVVIPTGKTAVEKTSGLRLTVKKIDSKKGLPLTEPEPTVVTLTVNTGICQDGTCTSREDAAQDIKFSTGQSLNYGGYNLSVKGLTLDSATITVAKAL